MKNLFYLVLLTTMVCLSVVRMEGESPPEEHPECPFKGQEYFECAPCTGTCENRYPACPLTCGPGCACPLGKVLNEGICIKSDECPKACDIEGQKKFFCAPCTGTCEEPNPVCPLVCIPGCACPVGEVVKDGTHCVNIDECPKACDIEGQKYFECAPCTGTCEEPNPVCPKDCKPGCACPVGKVLKDGKKCVKPRKCQEPEECDIKGQKYYKGCAPCTGTCEDPNPVCPEICKPGCACRKGRVVRNGEECVSPKKCPKGCEEGGKTYKDGET